MAVRKIQRERFLEAFALVGNVTDAANEAGIDRGLHYDWLKSDPEYAARYAQAAERAVDALEREARRRAVVGTEEPVYHLGKPVGSIRKYSDVLLIFLLKGARPEKYRDRWELTGANGKPLAVDHRVTVHHELRNLSEGDLRELERLLEKAATEAAGRTIEAQAQTVVAEDPPPEEERH